MKRLFSKIRYKLSA